MYYSMCPNCCLRYHCLRYTTLTWLLDCDDYISLKGLFAYFWPFFRRFWAIEPKDLKNQSIFASTFPAISSYFFFFFNFVRSGDQNVYYVPKGGTSFSTTFPKLPYGSLCSLILGSKNCCTHIRDSTCPGHNDKLYPCPLELLDRQSTNRVKLCLISQVGPSFVSENKSFMRQTDKFMSSLQHMYSSSHNISSVKQGVLTQSSRAVWKSMTTLRQLLLNILP